ncbi:MAG: hypothetical protein P4L33_16725 [Capsulimonadaceae bacterium]|nr:hypothetical protein [Capsulimonadaceae bacterium]
MSYAYSITTVLDLIRQLVVGDLTAQGQPPGSVPYSFTAAQYAVTSSGELPLTVIEVKDGQVERGQGINTRSFRLPLVVHHYRCREAGASAETVALGLLAHLAATIENDPKLSLMDPPVSMHETRPKLPAVSGNSDMFQSLQNVSIAHAVLELEVAWDEFRWQ